MSRAPTRWPERPERFYDDWPVFCAAAVGEIMKRKGGGDMVAVALLAGGAVLGAGGMMSLIAANREAIARKGKEWGIEELSTYAMGGGALVGAALGGLSGALLTRVLSKRADPKAVDALQAQLAAGRRQFETLRHDRESGRMTLMHHKLAVERLFMELAPSP